MDKSLPNGFSLCNDFSDIIDFIVSCFCQVTVEGVMGKIRTNDSDFGANFDVINLRADGQHKVIW